MKPTIQQLYKLDELLSICKSCEKKSQFQNNTKTEVVCAGCETYTKIREIGNQLERKKEMKPITLEQYNDYKAKGLTDTQIAFEHSTSPSSLSNIKKKWGICQQKPGVEAKKHSECKCTKEDKSSEYEALISQLERQLKGKDGMLSNQHETMKKLESKIEELESLHAACEDVESEVDSIRKERNEYLQLYLDAENLTHRQDYQLENQKQTLVHLRKTLGTLTAENKYLWGLVGIQAAEKNA